MNNNWDYGIIKDYIRYDDGTVYKFSVLVKYDPQDPDSVELKEILDIDGYLLEGADIRKFERWDIRDVFDVEDIDTDRVYYLIEEAVATHPFGDISPDDRGDFLGEVIIGQN